MRLESLPKLFAAKSSMISDSPRATATDALTGTDYMAAIGLADLKSGFGLDLFLAKMGISSPDRAVESLVKYAFTQTSKHKAIEQLDDDIKQAVVQLLANFAYQDYARSAASTRECDCCHGEGFIDAEVFTTKTHTPWVAKDIVKTTLEWGFKITPSDYEVRRELREVVRVLCPSCKGKKVLSNACRCNGRGEVLDKAETERQGVPVYKDCCKCSGRGYSKLPAEDVRRALIGVDIEISQPSWSRNFKPFYEHLITKCHTEESYADSMLSKVTL